MTQVIDTLYDWLSFLPQITKTNILEIIIIAFLIYEILVWIKTTRAWTLLKGIAMILVFALIAWMLKLYTILWIMQNVAFVATTALIIIFQPELRRALEQLGRRNILTDLLPFEGDRGAELGLSEKTVNELIRATFEMAKVRTGALIVIEREESLKEVESTGIEIDAVVTSQLLINIFEHNTPLHDGAVVIRGNRVTAATCYLPRSDNANISKDLGTRHRAAVGISEVTDSLTIVVSEETGYISLAEDGKLSRITTPEALSRALLTNAVQEGAGTGRRFRIWKGRQKDERKAETKADA